MTTHRSEEELIAYQLGESPDHAAIAAHLDHCSDCAQTAESIAETLRIFSGETVPQVNLDHAWQRLRGNLSSLASPISAAKPGRWQGRLAWFAVPALAAALLATGIRIHHPHTPANIAVLPSGPLSVQPKDPQVAAHLENAERLLTEINHADGPLDEPTRNRAQQLLVSNAVYVQRARSSGDVAQASILEELGRTLTNVEHAPAEPRKGWDLRMEINTSGLLLDIRVLQQNDTDSAKDHQ